MQENESKDANEDVRDGEKLVSHYTEVQTLMLDQKEGNGEDGGETKRAGTEDEALSAIPEQLMDSKDVTHDSVVSLKQNGSPLN